MLNVLLSVAETAGPLLCCQELFHMAQEVCIQVVCWHIKSFRKKDRDVWLAGSFMCRFPATSTCSRKAKRGLCQKLNTKGPIIVSCLLFNDRLSLHFSSCCVIKRNDAGHRLYSLSAWTIHIIDSVCWPDFSRCSLTKTVHA